MEVYMVAQWIEPDLKSGFYDSWDKPVGCYPTELEAKIVAREYSQTDGGHYEVLKTWLNLGSEFDQFAQQITMA